MKRNGNKSDITLALETAIDGGSISIRQGNAEIDSWIGTSEISKAEDVLQGLADLLSRNKIEMKKIGLTAVSIEAGSATGLKIGLATAKGLSKALGCPLLLISMWDALAQTLSTPYDAVAEVFLPAGKSRFSRRELSGKIFSEEIQIINRDQLQTILETNAKRNLYIHRKIIQENDFPKTARLKDLGCNLAGFISEIASDNDGR